MSFTMEGNPMKSDSGSIAQSVLEAGFLPKIINYEHCHLVPKIRFACKHLLESKGYQFLEVGKDTLAVQLA